MLGSVLASGYSIPALAQTLPPDAPQIRVPSDPNGVDLSTGQVVAVGPSISIGTAGQHGLTYTPEMIKGRYWTSNYDNSLEESGSKVFLFLGGAQRSFTLSGGVYTSDQADGATLTTASGIYTYKTRDGTTVIFSPLTIGLIGTQPMEISETHPDGEVRNYYYKVSEQCYEVFGSEYCVPYERIQSVTSTAGYQAKFAYAGSDVTVYDIPISVTLLNNSVEYCDPNADICTFANSWPTLSFVYGTSGSNTTYSITDSLSQITQFTFDGSSQLLLGVQRPGSSSNDVTYGYDANARISSVAVPGHTTNYGFSLAGTTLTGVISDTIGTSRTTTADNTNNVILTDKNGLNNTTSYTYDSYERPTLMTYPEGNQIKYTYDTGTPSRGNITEVRLISKTPGTPADITYTANFDATCSNQVKCNKPNWTKDPLGNETDYTYDPTTGLPLTITQPAPVTGGTQPKVTNTYASKYAWIKNSAGTLVQAPSSISVLATKSACLTNATCSGTADEQKTTITYQAGSSSVPSNILPLSVSVGAGDGSVSAVTAATYDIVGNVSTLDGPLSGTGDTTAFKYDALRRKVGTISPDPDGAGSLPNMATRTTYDVKGRVTTIEQGTTAGQTDAAWTAFSPAAKLVTTYDGADRKLTETLMNGTTSYALTQTSYDTRGRVDCSTVRMNPAIYASLPSSACTLGTVGSFGNDKVTKYAYDAADHITQVQSAYGTAGVSSESTAYTNNGLVSYVVDANLNRTTNTYDGDDRLSKTSYPLPTKGSNASSTTDYEQLTYDAASNITALRQRDGGSMSFTFDHLNRMITRTPPSEPVVNFGYNLIGMPTTVQRPSDGINITNAYDALGRVISETEPYGSASYQYDAAGNITKLTWSDGFYVNYDYDQESRVTKIRENGATTGIGVLASYAYDTLGRRSSITYGNGTGRSYAFDPVNRLTGLKIDLAGTTSDEIIGQVGTGTAIAYNPASQILSITRSNDAYAYGGRVNVSRSYITNGLNQYTAAGSVSFGYDGRGNLTSSTPNSYTYSKLNELKTGPGVSAMVYDGDSRLSSYAAGSTTRFTYSGASLIDERNTSGTILRRYIPGPGNDEPIVWYEGSGTTARHWLQADERGSIVAVSDDSGNVIGINSYDESGIPASTNIGRFQYTGQTWFTEIGLYNFKARFYSPTMGRFLETDPIGYYDGLNWYNYVHGDPINGVDPLGTEGVPDCAVVSCAQSVANDIVVTANRQGNLNIYQDPSFNFPNLTSWGSSIPSLSLADSNEIVVTAFKPPKYNQDNPNYHHYTFTNFICSGAESGCTIPNVYDALTYLAAPGLPGRAFDGRRVYIPGIGHVVQFVDSTNYTVFNVTTGDHAFDPGYVERTVVPSVGGVSIQTTGYGTGGDRWFNLEAAFPGFSALDLTIRSLVVPSPNIYY